MNFPRRFSDTPEEILNHELVQYLLHTVAEQSIKINHLEAEIRLLKGHSSKPTIPPNSNLEGVKSNGFNGVKKNFFY